MKKKTPVRLCLGCNNPGAKNELIRIVKNKEGDISVDFTGKKPGRGAYICNDPACLAKLEKNKRLQRAFSAEISADVWQRLKEEIACEK